MASSVAVARVERGIARPIKVLIPLIQEEIAAGKNAGLEHYRQAGELLLEARDQVAAFKWGKWLSENFSLSKSTAYDYMNLAERFQQDPDIFQHAGNSIRGILHPKEQQTRAARHAAFKLHKPVDIFDAARQARAEEIRLLRLLAIELVDVGFKALATRLHPDHGGSTIAFQRLNRVRRELKAVAQSRRYE